MRRRRFLQWAGVGAATALAGCSDDADLPWGPDRERSPTDRERNDPPTQRNRDDPSVERAPGKPPVERRDFDRVVNVVEAGADANGQEPIDDVLNRELRDGTLFEFPDGRYKLRSFSTDENVRYGMAAVEGTKPTLVPAVPLTEVGEVFLEVEDAEAFLFDGFVLDFEREGYGGAVVVRTRGDFTIRNVRTLGRYPRKSVGFHFAVENENRRALVENLVSMGGKQGGETVGIFVNRQHAGDLTVRNCHLENFPNNGLYASAPGDDGKLRSSGGIVRVVGGFYRNNNIANVRLGDRCVARNVTIVVDTVPPYNELNARGLWVVNGTNQLIDGCSIYLGKDAGDSLGALVFYELAGNANVRNTQIVTNRDQLPAVNLQSPSDVVADAPGSSFDNVSITGTASGGRTVVVEDRDRTEFLNCEISQSGTDRNGIVFQRSNDCSIANTTIDVTGRAIRSSESSVQRRHVKVV